MENKKKKRKYFDGDLRNCHIQAINKELLRRSRDDELIKLLK